MDPEFEEIARIALAACADHGFVLAGGNALLAHGIGDRVTHDVDLFTNVADPDSFRQAVQVVKRTLEDRGDLVRVERADAGFARVLVTPSSQSDDVMIEFAYDYRRFPAVSLDIGPVLDPRDALANKLCALYDRGAERDFIDVHRAIASGVVNDWTEAIALADQQSATPPPREYVLQGLKYIDRLDDRVLARYGLEATDIELLRAGFAHALEELQAKRSCVGSPGHLARRSDQIQP